jgi:hypothetical protein
MGFWTIAAIALSVISGGASYVQAKKAAKLAKRTAKQGESLLINDEGTNSFIPVIYGTRRVAGTRVFIATNDTLGGDPNKFLYLVYVLCEGEIDDITDILIDDLPVTDPRFAYTNSIAINKFYGTDVQTADATFIAAGIGWTADHTLTGLAYITVRLKWNSNAFSSIPNITALVRGKKVYDPRTTLTAYSTNPALCIRDYLTNTRYGKGLVAADLDDQSFEDAADFYDNTVTFWTSGTVGKLFEFNAVIDTEQTILDNIKDMLFCCRGFLPYTNGVYQLIPDKSASSVFAFTTDNIVGGISVRGESKDDKFNKVILTFTDPDNNWQENTAIFPDADDTSYFVADNNVELVGDFDLPCITNYYAARDLARVFLLRSRNALRCGFNANSDALNLTVGDVVTVTHPTPGFSAKPFQVEEISINYDGTCRVALLEYDSSIYTYDPASEQLAYPDTDLPDPYSVVAPTSFVVTEITYLANDGTVVPEISVAWTESADAYVEYYEFQFKINTDSVWLSAITYEPIYVTTFATVGETYDIRARAVNSLGVQSGWLTGSYTVVGDTTAPAIPTGVTITGDYNQVTATWSAATEKDYKESWVYQNTTGVTPLVGDTPFRKVTGNTVTASGLAPSTTYYVWVRNVDFSDNRSGFSSAGTFTTTAGASIADGSVTTAKIVDSAVVAAKIGTSAVTQDKINALAVTAAKVAAGAIETAKIADLAVASGKIAALAITDDKIAASAITTTKISDLAISTPKLAAGAVTAEKITAGTITANEIAASTITGAKIAANTITAGNIAALTITANEIAANAITAGKILAGEITGDKISATFTTTSNLVLTTAGKLYTSGKTSAASTAAGVFLGWDGVSAYDFAVGDGTKSIVYDGGTGAFTITNVDITTSGVLKSTGGTLSIDVTGAVVGQPSSASVAGVVGRSTNSHGVYGRSTTGVGVTGVGSVGVSGEGASGGVVGNSGVFGIYFDTGVGIRGYGLNVGVFGQGVVGGRFAANAATGVAIDIPTGYIARTKSTTAGVLEVWDTATNTSQGTFYYEFRS